MIVIAAAAFIDAVDGRRPVHDRLMNEDIHAPHLLDIEVVSGLRHLVAGGRFDAALATEALSILEQAEIRRHPHTPLLPAALRGRVSAYDAAYVALAAALDAPLLTTDRKLAGLSGLPCSVEAP